MEPASDSTRVCARDRGLRDRRPADADRPLRRGPRERAPGRPRRARDRGGGRAQRPARGRRSTRSTWAAPTRRARTTATSRGWGCCSPGLPVEVPGVTVNRLCASGLEAVNQARAPDHARRRRPGAGRRRRVDDARAARDAEAGPLVPARRPAAYDTTIGWRFVEPAHGGAATRTEAMGETAENVAERYGIAPRGAGRVRAREPPARAGGAGGRPLRRGDRPGAGAAAEGRAGHRPLRRGPARRHDAREARPAAAGVPRGRHGDRRQLLPDQRRRGLPRAGHRGARRASSGASRSRASCRSAPPASSPRYMGIGPVPATRKALARRGPRDRRHRPGRAERGVRLAGAGLRARARASTTSS